MTLFFEPFAPLFDLSRQMPVNAFAPAADVVVTDDDVTVVMDVPGLTADDVTIELEEDVLTVRGERPLPYKSDEQQGKVWQRVERGFGKFERVLSLPSGLDPDAISASLSDGVLTLHIPKPEERKPRRVQIATGSKTETIEATATEPRELAGATA